MIPITFNEYNFLLHAVKKSIFHRFIEALKNITAKAMAENFLDPSLTNFPSFRLNALLRPDRLFQKTSSGLGFIYK